MRSIEEQIDTTRALLDHFKDPQRCALIQSAAVCVAHAFKNGGKLLLFGNGGSAADAQHLAAEFAGKFQLNRGPLPALALTVNSSSVTAIANDYGYEDVFARQVRGLIAANDVAIGISTSGNSRNVIAGIIAAKERRALTIALTGSGGELRRYAGLVISVPSADTPRIQEVHIMIGHLICHIVEEMLFGQEGKHRPV